MKREEKPMKTSQTLLLTVSALLALALDHGSQSDLTLCSLWVVRYICGGTAYLGISGISVTQWVNYVPKKAVYSDYRLVARFASPILVDPLPWPLLLPIQNAH
jgi:hypothetical protein